MTRELDEYIAAHTSAEPPLLHDLYRATFLERLYPRMCSGHVQGRILAMLSAMVRPRRILELGTFTGYSAICLAEGLAPGGRLHTIEIDDEAEPFISRWIERAGLSDRITLYIGDALKLIPEISREPWNLVYIDANKRHYCEYLEAVLPYLAEGAFIIADNTLWDGKVTDPEVTDKQTEGIRRFNDMVARHPRLETVILPLRDGLTVMRLR